MEETKKKGSGTTDLTVGRPLTRILQFALPLVLGTLFQQLYSFVDTVIVGRCISTDALGAVGTTYSLNFMIVGFVLATCNGFGIPVAESFGAKDRDDLHKYLFNGAVLCVVMSLVFAVVTTLVAAPLLQLIHTPAELLENAVRYIRIIFLGIPATVLYNYSSTVLRSLGDSKHPFYFLLVSAVLNTGLDLLFVLKFGMGVEGVAYATIIAQAVSAALTIWVLMRAAGCIRVELRALRMTWSVLRQIVSVGIPAALQMAITAFSNVFVQGYINYFGPDCMSGWTAYTKVDQLVILPVQSIAMAGTTFVGQNLGVGDTARAKKGVRTALYLSFAVTAVLLVPVLLLAPDLTAFFNSKAEVVSYGALLLRLLSPFYFFFCINQIYSAALRGAGNSQMPMWIMLGSFVVFRQIYLYITAHFIANEIVPIALSYPAGWFVCSAATLLYYRRCRFDKHRLVEDV